MGMCMSKKMMSKGLFLLASITLSASSPFMDVLMVLISGISYSSSYMTNKL
jgi:hypothetical protein